MLLDKILCCHYNSNNVHTYVSGYIKTNQTKLLNRKTEKGQAASEILSRSFGAAFVAFPARKDLMMSAEGIKLSLTLEKLQT